MNEYQKLAIRALNQMRGNNANSAEIEAAIYWVEQQKECEYEDEDFEEYEEDASQSRSCGCFQDEVRWNNHLRNPKATHHAD